MLNENGNLDLMDAEYCREVLIAKASFEEALMANDPSWLMPAHCKVRWHDLV